MLTFLSGRYSSKVERNPLYSIHGSFTDRHSQKPGNKPATNQVISLSSPQYEILDIHCRTHPRRPSKLQWNERAPTQLSLRSCIAGHGTTLRRATAGACEHFPGPIAGSGSSYSEASIYETLDMSKNVTPTQGVFSLSAVHAAQWAARSKLFTTSKNVCGSATHAMTPTSSGMGREGGVQGEWEPRIAPNNQEEVKEVVVEEEEEGMVVQKKEEDKIVIEEKEEEGRSSTECKSLSLTTDPEPLYAEVIKRK